MPNNSANRGFTPKFSHLYVEKAARDYALTEKVLARFPDATWIEIDRYRDVFARPRQHFQMQKQAMKLILAVKPPPFVYPGADVCHDFGNAHFYYTSSTLNCLYNCEYCFLQGMFPSGHAVFFVNLDDYFQAVSGLLAKHPVYLCISYESDLLAFEGLAPFCAEWIRFAAQQPDLTIELRTKSTNLKALAALKPNPRVILAWTLSPQTVIDRHEPGTPGLEARLTAAANAIRDGWDVRLCFDPVLHVERWEEAYLSLIETTFSRLPADRIRDISVGLFRVPKDFMLKMRRARPDSALLHYPFVSREGVYRYPDEVSARVMELVLRKLYAYVPAEKVFVD